MVNPFDNKNINYIFRFRNSDNNTLVTRENTKVEFKENFNWANKSKYAKTMAAFANHDGGFIVFGVKDSPREVIGITSTSFEKIDEQQITSYLNENFSPEITWMKEVIEIRGVNIGLIYVFELNSKPAICTKNDRDIKEADIYYRYSGRSERIKYPELTRLLNIEKDKEKSLWMKHMSKISKIGIENVALLDTNRGTIHGDRGIIYIDENLVKEIQFIKEGEFNEKEGSKTLKLIGEVTEVSGSVVLTTKIKLQGIGTRELFEALVHGKLHEGIDSREYLKQLPFERSSYMPIFIFKHLGKLSDEDVISTFNQANTTFIKLRKSLIKRISEQKTFSMGTYNENIITEGLVFSEIDDFKTYIASKSSYKKDYIRSLLLNLMLSKRKENIYDFINDYFENVLECITHFNKVELEDNRNFIAEIMMYIYDANYVLIAPKFRNAICYIDELLYRG